MKKITEELLDTIKKEEQPIVIYGAGKVASTCLEKMMIHQIDVECVAVTSMESNPLCIWGKSVRSIEDILLEHEEFVVLIAVLEDKQEDIEESLIQRGIKEENIYGMTDELYHNWRLTNSEKGIHNKQVIYYKRYIEPYIDTLNRICKESKMSREEAYHYMQKEIKTLETEELCMARLVVVLGTKCSLRCKDCNNLMPYFKPQKDLDAEKIINSLEIITKNIGKLLKCELIGGEPFLAKNLGEVLQYVLDNEKIESIEITTNGMILPKAEVVNLLQNPRVLVRISDYGTVIDQTSMIEFLEQNQIRYFILGSSNWVTPGGVEKRYKDAITLKKEYENCSSGYICKTLYKDKIFACARAASLYNLGYMKEPESIHINENFKVEYLKKFLLREFSIACDHCDIAAENKVYVDAAIQIKK